MPAVFEYPVLVRLEDIDAQGHAGNVRYIEWMQSAAVAHSAAQGWTAQRYEQNGLWWVVREHAIKYLQPAFEKDALIVRTWVSDMKRSSSLRKYKILRGDELLAAAETNWVLVDARSRALACIPAEMSASFQVVNET